MHLKRNKMPRHWPLKRKGTKYVAVPSHGLNSSISLLTALRDILKLVKNRKETKKLVNAGKIKVNAKIVKNENYALGLFDILSFENKNLKIIIGNKKFALEEINKEEPLKKIVKVIGKKIIKNNKTQVNLMDGRNYLTDEKIKVGDSAVIDLNNSKILKILPFKEKCRVMIMTGKNMGNFGVVEEIDKSGLIRIKLDSRKINSRLNNLMVVE